MKRLLVMILAAAGIAICANAQKFALIDMEYVLRNIPAYEIANQQLLEASQKWEKEVADLQAEADAIYQNYQADMSYLSDALRKKYEEQVVAKEKEVTDLRYKYFGPEGELFKKRQALMQPIQDDVYKAVKAVSEEKGYQAVFDRASSQSIVFASPRIDISNEVLAVLGYSK